MLQRTVLITGVSSGLGRAFAIQLLNAGYRIVGTVRRAELVPEFEAQKPGAAFARVLDLKNQDAIQPVVEDVEMTVGPIDVLINNAGYGHEGILEGPDAFEFVNKDLDALRSEFAQWETVTRSTNFDQ